MQDNAAIARIESICSFVYAFNSDSISLPIFQLCLWNLRAQYNKGISITSKKTNFDR